MATLYRKYRPQNFEEVVGQSHIKLTLEHEIESDKLAHAYLFCGPRAVGKTTLARVLAKAINCANRKEGKHEPCNKCENCEEITGGKSLDIIEIDAASHTGVDNVRENIIAQARVVPSKLRYKVFIIDEVHMLSISAFNALLKVLEEPPQNVIFILCTTETHKVPTTIISRCQRFDFKRINISDIVKKLNYIIKTEKIKIDKSILEAIARQSEGHMRDAESLLGQVVSIGGKEITQEEADLVIPRSDLGEAINLIGMLGQKDASSCLELVNKLIDQGVDLKTFLNDLIEILRKIMFAKLSPALAEKLGLELGESLEIKINEVSKDLSLNQLVIFIEQFIKARGELKGSFVIQLPVELAVIRLCSGVNATLAASRDRGQASVAPSSISQPQQNIRPFGDAPSNSAGRQDRPIIASALNQTIKSQSVAPTPNVKAKEVANINKEQVLEKWNEVLAKVKKYNHSLSFILRVCEPRQIDGNQLCLAFKYKFHKDRVSDINIKSIVEKVLGEVYSAPLTIEAIIDESLDVGDQTADNAVAKEETRAGVGQAENKEGTQGKMIDNLLKTFGGKVVE